MSSDERKVTVSFRPVGSTKKLQKSMILVQPSHKFATLVKFLRRQLSMKEDQSLFCYINSSFSPSLDAEVGSLSAMYAIDGVLAVSYCNTVAFG